MSWIDNIKQALGRNIRLPFVRLIGHEKVYGQSPLHDNQQRQSDEYKSWVFACASRNAFSIAKATGKLYKKRLVDGQIELEEVTEHPFLDVWNTVNPHFNKFELMTLLSLHQDLTGNAYWWMPKGRLGVPIAIWDLPSQWMRVVPSETKFISGYVMKMPNQAQPIPFPEEDIVHFRYPNPNDMYYGISPVWAAAQPIDLNNQFKKWGLNFIGNNAQPAGVLQTDTTLGEKQYNRLRDMWNMRHRGASNAGRMAILEQGLKYVQTGSNLKDLSMTDINPLVRDEILAIFGVPASKLGLVEDVNRANADANDYTYQKETVLPRLTLIEEKINEKIMPMYSQDDGMPLIFKFDNPVPEDKEFKLKATTANLLSGLTSVDEEREELGLDKLGLIESTVPTIPMGRVPMQTEEQKAENDAKLDEQFNLVNAPDDKDKDKKHFKSQLDDKKIDIFESTVKPQEKLFERTMRKFFEEQGKIISENITRYKSMTKADDGLDENILWNMNEQIDKLARASRPHIEQAFSSGVNIVGSELGISFDLLQPNLIRSVQSRVTFFSEEVNKTTAKLISQAVANGEGIEDIATRLQTIDDFNLKTRARRVAQTEVIGATNEGQFDAYTDAGMTHKKWLTARDERVRPAHAQAERDGFILRTQEFSNGLQYPGDRKSSGSTPENLINCRCSFREIRRS